MGDQDQGRRVLLVQAEQQLAHTLPGAAVQVAGGLVGEEQARAGGKRPGQGDPLLLATRELARVVADPRGEAHPGEALERGGARVVPARELERQHHVLQGGEARNELEGLEHEAHQPAPQAGAPVLVQGGQVGAVEPDTPRGGEVQAGEEREQGRLAGAGFPDDRQGLAGGHRQPGPREDLERPLGARDALSEFLGAEDRWGRWTFHGALLESRRRPRFHNRTGEATLRRHESIP